jgi:tetratricopeptide (TPR) repeat protein
LNVIDSYIALDRYAEATRLIDRAEARHVFSDWLHAYRFNLAFAAGDQTAMDRARLAVAGRPTEKDLLWSDADAAAFRGRLRDARAVRTRVERLLGPSARMVLSARASMLDAAVGLSLPMVDVTRPMPNIARYTFAAAAALAGDTGHAAFLLRDDDIPLDSRRLVTASRALIGAVTGNRAPIEELVADSSTQLGQFLGFEPVYLRGLAYLHVGDGTHAAGEFQRIIAHRGVDLTSPLYPLAYVQRARAYTCLGDAARARKDYEQFFEFWKDADADVPILKAAKDAYAKLIAAN